MISVFASRSSFDTDVQSCLCLLNVDEVGHAWVEDDTSRYMFLNVNFVSVFPLSQESC